MNVYIQSRSDPLPVMLASEITDPDFIAEDFNDPANSHFVKFNDVWYNLDDTENVWWLPEGPYCGNYTTFTQAVAFRVYAEAAIAATLLIQIDLDNWNSLYPPGTHVVARIGTSEWVCATIESPAYINEYGTPTVKLVRLNHPVALSKLYLARNQRIWPSTALRSSDASTSRRKRRTAPSRVQSTV